uniref:Uncharacterized protein n=1 Tax=Fagus sylvatica TaxID=28930 RepID=A0A2N9FWQ9_FAGSY
MPVERKKLMQQVKHNKRTEEHTEELRRAAEGKEIHSVEGQISGAASDTKEGQEERIITLRPLNMEDFRQAKSEVAASFATEGFLIMDRFRFGPVRVRSGLGLVRFKAGPVRLMRRARSVPGVCWRVPGVRWRVSGMCWHALSTCWRVGGAAGTSTGAWRRVESPVRLFFTPFFRSEDEEPYGGICCSIRCSEGWVFETVDTAARGGAWGFLAGASTGAWRRVTGQMVTKFCQMEAVVPMKKRAWNQAGLLENPKLVRLDEAETDLIEAEAKLRRTGLNPRLVWLFLEILSKPDRGRDRSGLWRSFDGAVKGRSD